MIVIFLFVQRLYKKYFDHYTDIKDFDSAEKVLKEAILHDETDVEAQLKLANHYLRTDNLETCSQLCNHMLKTVSDLSTEVLAVNKISSFFR